MICTIVCNSMQNADKITIPASTQLLTQKEVIL